MKRSFETVLVEQCAPTLAGVKPANLFCYQSQNRAQIYDIVNNWNKQLYPFGLALCIVKECCKTNSFLIYLYRRQQMDQIFSKQENQIFLMQMGYQLTDCDSLIQQLSARLCFEKEFPHEIGIFLGYPLIDVIGFIEHKGQNYSCAGYWKSYGDSIHAKKLFELYKKCISHYRQMYKIGIPILQLVTAA